ncbi:peroxidase family protein [Rhizobium tumorigenes]|uniref:peroxidase family protein n=1 Tax=Rhizobium tumorigenes TaxID=2041385 RepID=UPI00241C7F4C|nr:peroxidase family protein [Rhizobium tumorigenes]WFS03239.1 hypothetical protein PR016_21545 [Rhizobium tumorigenes]
MLSWAERRVTLADLIVLAGSVAVEKAAKAGGRDITVPFTPGRWTRAGADGCGFPGGVATTRRRFRNYVAGRQDIRQEEALVDRSQLLTLTAPEMALLVGGIRVLKVGQPHHGVLTERTETLINNFFVNLLDMNTVWSPAEDAEGVYEGRDRKTGEIRWTVTHVDLIFDSHLQLRAIAEVHAQSDFGEIFVRDFVIAWTRVMNADRFDLTT